MNNLEKIFKSKNKPETEQIRKRKLMNRMKQKIEDEETAKRQKLDPPMKLQMCLKKKNY